jgi:hypothetical protein
MNQGMVFPQKTSMALMAALRVLVLIIALQSVPMYAKGFPKPLSETISGTWYCPTSNETSRFDFGRDGSFSWYGYQKENGISRWTPFFTERKAYRILPGDHMIAADGPLSIKLINSVALQFRWGSTAYSCSRTPPKGDTPKSQVAAADAAAREDAAFIGVWVSRAGDMVKFFPNHACYWYSDYTKNSGTDQWRAYHGGKDAMCGSAGMYSHVGTDRLSYFLSSQMPPIIYHRKR